MTPDLAIQFFFRSFGAIAFITACFGSIIPVSAKLALVLAVSLLLSGPEIVPHVLSSYQSPGAGLQDFIAETFIGVLLSLPICTGCWAMLLASTWFSELLLPGSPIWFSREEGAAARNPVPRIKSLVISFLLLGGVSFFPYFQDVFARLAESIFVLPPHSKLAATSLSLSRTMFAISCQLAWTSAIALALPIIAVSWLFDFAAGVVSRYLKPLRADRGLWSFRVLLVGAALSASIYSLTEMVDQVSKAGASQKAMLKTVELLRQK